MSSACRRAIFALFALTASIALVSITIAVSPKKTGVSPVTVLMYHEIISGQEGTQFSIPVALFEKQMQYLADNGYKTILSEDYLKFLKGKSGLPEKAVMITFDDWTPGQYNLARPILNRLGLRAVFFVITSKLDSKMEKEKIKRLAAEGHEIGSHSVNHYYLTQSPCDEKWKCCHDNEPCSESQKRYEILQSRMDIMYILGPPVISFSWPGNYFDKGTAAMAVKAGYKAVYAVERKVREKGVLTNRVGVTKSPQTIYRTEIGGRCGMNYFTHALVDQRCCVVSERKFHRECIPQAP